MSSFNRRRFLTTSAASLAGASLLSGASGTAVSHEKESSSDVTTKFRYCFNTSCVRKAKLPLPELVELVSTAGYDGVKPWIGEIETYQKSGGNLKDLRKQLDDCGLQVESAIGFPNWGVDDDEKRAAAFEQAKREMELVRSLGGKRIAAPPAGINGSNSNLVDLNLLAKRYSDLLDLGVSMEVIPQLEIWGSAKNLSHIAQAAYVAVAANHPRAAILPDVYHLYRGGSDFHGLRLLSGQAINIFHMNDYPSSPPREETRDSDRVYPGDGVAPLDLILQSLNSIGFKGVLSLELFNDTYYQQPPAEVIATGLEKMKASVAKALA